MPDVVITYNNQETREFAAKFVAHPQTTINVLALIGDLGSGKTTFVQGIAQSLGITQPVTSPTFLLLKEYPVLKHSQFKNLIHLDLYRTDNWTELTELNLEELWSNKMNLVIIEWADRIKNHLPSHTQIITFEHLEENTRKINLTGAEI